MSVDKSIITDELIRKSDNVLGGSARIGDRRIAVWMLVQARRLGMADEEIRTRYRPPLEHDELEAAWRYFENHPAEIEQAILENEGA
jgi:uncharacterized protein (DUF433 family)